MNKAELHYFDGYPNSDLMPESVKESLAKIDTRVEFETVLIDTPEKAEKYKYQFKYR